MYLLNFIKFFTKKTFLIIFQNEDLLFRQYYDNPYAIYAGAIPIDGELCCVRYR